MRRIGFLLVGLFLFLFVVSFLAVTLATAALGSASSGVRIAAGLAGVLLFLLAILLVGRTVRRMAGPIGEVMDAADRVAAGDYSAQVSERGPREVRRLGRAFNEMTTRLQASDDQRRRLLADVTHELRTPLSVVQGNLEGMVDGVYVLDEERVITVLEQTRVLARLLDDLQTLSTADAGVLRLELEQVDLAALAADVVSTFAPAAADAGIELGASSDELGEVDVDPVRVRQVLDNLVTNALRHTPRGGRVTIRLTDHADGVEVAVEDTGGGIPADQLGTVFDRYAKSADSGGSGLGLAIARSLVEAHGGTIAAESEERRGATIRFFLPAASAAATGKSP